MSTTLRAFTVSSLALGALAACDKSTTPATAPLAAAAVRAISGPNVAFTVGGAVDTVAVFVGDGGDHPVAGSVVSWQVSGVDASLSSTSSITDDAGIARIVLTAGTHAGLGSLVATVNGVAPLSLAVEADPGAPAKLVAMSPTTDSLPEQQTWTFPAVQVQDQYGNAIAGATILATEIDAPDGDALLAPLATTDARGIVSETFVSGLVPGVRTIAFSTPDGTLSLNYTVDVLGSDGGTDTTVTNLRTAVRR